jgi:hypothetical protein
MIHRSGRSARNRVPISAAAALTRSTVLRSSVSGIVKNCGACGSIAPPITLDVITFVPIDRLSTLWRFILGGAEAGTWKRNNSAKA